MKKRGILSIILLLLCIVFMASSSAQQAVVTRVTIDPENPIRGTGFTMTAEFEMSDIAEVFVYIQECDAETGICYFSNNLTMRFEQPQVYTLNYEFEDGRATYFSYHFNIRTLAGTWIKTQDVEVDLIADPSLNGNGSDNSTPGFEIILSMLSIVLIALIFKRKRSQ